MVLASAKHPAMLVYLDNFQSIGPNSRGAQRGRGPPRAQRELRARAAGAPHAWRERRLHAAGRAGAREDPHRVDSRADCRTADPRLRGSASARQAEIGFAFQDPLHEPGARTVLGVKYSDAGVAQGEHVIRDLCRHAIDGARSSRPSWSRISSPTSRPPAPSSGSRASSARPAATFAPSRRRSSRLPEAWTGHLAQVPDAAGLAGGGSSRGECAGGQRR